MLPTPADIKPCEWCKQRAWVKPVYFNADSTRVYVDGPYYLCDRCKAWAYEARKAD